LIFLLDTNAASGIIRSKHPLLSERLIAAHEADAQILVSALVAFELLYGAAHSANPSRTEGRVRYFLIRWKEPVPFTMADAEIAGELREHLSRRGEMIGPYDLLIAAQAIRLKAILVTNNVREFSRVPGLSFEDWSAEEIVRQGPSR
jgi:tRNA(fMet)-specific endonuclease VapC